MTGADYIKKSLIFTESYIDMLVIAALLPIIAALVMMCKFKVAPGKAMPAAWPLQQQKSCRQTTAGVVKRGSGSQAILPEILSIVLP